MRSDQRQKSGARGDACPPTVWNSAGVTTIPFAQRLTSTVAEAREATGLGRTKLCELIGEGCLKTTTIGRRPLVLVRSLRTLFKAGDS